MDDNNPPDEPTLRDTATGGIAWTLLGQIVTQGVRLVLLVVLARLLDPVAFGLVGMTAVFTGFAAQFVDAGFVAALVQRPNITSRHVASAFWVSVVVGAALAVLIAASGPLIARLYGEPILTPLMIVSAPTFIFAGLAATPKALLQRAMSFRTIARVQMLSVALSGTIGIGLAARGAGVWSLVAMTVVLSATMTIGFWRGCEDQIVGRFDRLAAAELWRFGRNVMGFNAINYWARQADNLLIGWRIGAEALGLYTRAYSLILFPVTQVGSILGHVMFPALSRIQGDLTRVRSAYLAAVGQIATVTFPAMVGLVLVAPEFVSVVFGTRWMELVPIVQVLGLVGALQSVGTTVGWLFQALDETRVMFRWGLGFSTIVILSFIVGVRYGVIGVAVAYGIASISLIPLSVHLAGRKANVTPRVFARALAPAATATAIMAGVMLLAGRITGTLPDPVTLLLNISLGTMVYVAAAFLVMPRTLRSTFNTFRAIVRGLVSTQPQTGSQ